MDKALEKSKEVLDELEEQTKGVSWRILDDLDDTDDASEDSDYDDDVAAIAYNSDSSVEAPSSKNTLGQKVIDIWQKRRDKLVSDFCIAGWLLSPMPEVRSDADENMTGAHRNAVDRLLKQMYAAELADDSDELGGILNTFWSEYEHFQNKSGVFEKAYIWNKTNSDLQLGKSHMWHKKNSYFQTKVLGKFACRVCSKIVGMGSAERSWGDVKHLKSMKRSHLSPQAVEKQATIFGASCMADAALERDNEQDNSTDSYKFWDEKDFDSQFDMFAVEEPAPPNKRFLKCYIEEWEKEHVKKNDDVSKAKLLQKYGGLEFEDIDKIARRYRIDPSDMSFRRNNGWCAHAILLSDPSAEPIPWVIGDGCALHDCLATYYFKYTEKNIQPLLLERQKDEITFLQDAVKKREAAKTSPKKNKRGTACRKDDGKRNKRKDSPSTHTEEDNNVPPVAVVTTGNNMSPCRGCGTGVGPVHKCDICKQSMHPWCGRPIGEEGHGQAVRCPQCDKNK